MMGEHSPDATDNRPYQTGRGVATRFTDDVRELAYQLWAFQHGGNCERVSASLAKHTPPITVDARSVRRWANDGQWAIRRADDWRRLAPDLIRQTMIEARYGLLESAVMARQIVNDDRILKITTLTPSGSQRTEEVPAVAAKDRVAAGSLLQKIHADLQTFALAADHPASSTTHDLRSLTDSELLELERNT